MTVKTQANHVRLTTADNGRDILYCTHCGDITPTDKNHPFPQIITIYDKYYQTHKTCAITLTDHQMIEMAQKLTKLQHAQTQPTTP